MLTVNEKQILSNFLKNFELLTAVLTMEAKIAV
jgi:hypothetical protein